MPTCSLEALGLCLLERVVFRYTTTIAYQILSIIFSPAWYRRVLVSRYYSLSVCGSSITLHGHYYISEKIPANNFNDEKTFSQNSLQIVIDYHDSQSLFFNKSAIFIYLYPLFKKISTKYRLNFILSFSILTNIFHSNIIE